MASQDELHQLIDELPEALASQVLAYARFLQQGQGSPLPPAPAVEPESFTRFASASRLEGLLGERDEPGD